MTMSKPNPLTLTCDLPIFIPLIKILSGHIRQHPNAFSITLNYRSPDYSAESGGYRPVEIRLERLRDKTACWTICYVTEFSYFGPPGYQELDRAIDFDFSIGTGYQAHQAKAPQPIRQYAALFCLWQRNFSRYHDLGIYQCQVTLEEQE